MTRTSRRTLSFDAMEGRVLLSVGGGHRHRIAHSPAMVHRTKTTQSHVMLNGNLSGIPMGTVGQNGITVSSFSLVGQTLSMGKVAGSLALTNTLIAPGQKPDLGNATLTISNMKGSVQVKMAASPSNRYIFIVSNGTGAYASAYGSGVTFITYNTRLHEYQIYLRSARQ